jgi:TRAP-type transport system periplasmic protein
MHTNCGPSTVHTLTKPVKTLEDLKGLKIRATGRVADIVKTLGAVPMPLEMADMYDSMRRGVVDGNCGPYEQLKGWKIGELVKYATASWKAGSIYTFYVVMNKNKWNALPPDIQKTFAEAAAEFKERYAVLWNEYDIDGREFLQSKGGQTILLSDEEAKKWQKAVEPVINEFTQDLISKGYTQKDVDGYISYIRERIDYWAKEEKVRRIPTAY